MRRIASIGHGKTLTAGFEYDGRNQLTVVTYPSGRVVEYNRNANGRVTSVVATYNGVATTVASGVLYEPFGPPRLLNYGNGLTQARGLDSAYMVTEVNLLDVATFSFFDSVAYTPDANGNVDAYTDYLTSAKSRDYTHDALDRLTRDSGYTPGSGDTYGYDANGNRLTRTAATQNQGLAYVTGSNRISTYNGSSLAYDGMGNLLGRGSVQFAYAASGRLREVNIGSQTWARQVYNGVGELARNRVTADDPCSVEEILLSTDYPLYGPTGQVLHLVTENGAGVAVDYVWLDDLPLAQFENSFDAQGVEQGTPKVTYLHADHLGTPRIGTNQAQQITWRWEATEAFGQSLPTGTDIVRLRFPGQVDLQVGMISYNYFRSYDALLGRYLESDPIGLEGGLNTYGYARQNPLRFIDPLGLAAACGNDPDCIARCLKAYFGDWYDRALDASIFGLLSFGAREAVELGLNEIGESLEDRLSRQANRALYGGGASYERGKRLLRTLKQFRAFNAGTNLLVVGATSFVTGAQINCRVRCELQ